MSKLPLLNPIRSCLSLTLALSCLVSPAFAQSSVSIYDKLNEYEQTLFGKPETSMPVEKRLQQVEKQLFGKAASKGTSTPDRVTEIDKVMAGTKYLPPVAPEMDRSEFAPQPKQAPDSPDVAERTMSRDIEAPLPADSGDRVKGILRQAMQAYSQGKTVEAESGFLKVLSMDFRNVDANYNLGAIHESKGDLESAKRYYSAALKSDPGDPEIADALAAVQSKLKTQVAKAAPKLAPSPSTSQSQAQAPSQFGHAPVTAADRAIAQEAAASYKKGNFDDAIDKLNYLARKNPFDANTQFALGQAYRGKGKDQEAIRHLRSAATLDPKNDLYVKSLGDYQAMLDEKQTASAGGGSSADGQGKPDVQPFVGLPTDSQTGRINSSDMASLEDYLRRSSGNVMMGSVTSFGGPGRGFSSWSSFGGGGIPMTLGTAPGGTRLKRAMTSSLAGAAMGAMTNRNQPGGMSKGAMRGAMYGGLYGLMLGGY